MPAIVFQLDIPQIMPVMSALVFSLLLGLAATWTRAAVVTQVLEEFQQLSLIHIYSRQLPTERLIRLSFLRISRELQAW